MQRTSYVLLCCALNESVYQLLFAFGPLNYPSLLFVVLQVDVWSIGIIFYQCLYGKKASMTYIRVHLMGCSVTTAIWSQHVAGIHFTAEHDTEGN